MPKVVRWRWRFTPAIVLLGYSVETEIHRGRSAAGIGQPVGFGGGGGWTDAPVACQPKSDASAVTGRGNSLHSQLSRCPTFVPMMKTANLRQRDHLPKVRRLHRPTRRRVLLQRKVRPSLVIIRHKRFQVSI